MVKCRIMCVLCKKIIAETTDAKISVAELAKRSNLAEIKIKTKEEEQGGYLCEECLAKVSANAEFCVY